MVEDGRYFARLSDWTENVAVLNTDSEGVFISVQRLTPDDNHMEALPAVGSRHTQKTSLTLD